MISKNFTKKHLTYDEQIEDLLKEYPEIPIDAMGFPENWKERLS